MKSRMIRCITVGLLSLGCVPALLAGETSSNNSNSIQGATLPSDARIAPFPAATNRKSTTYRPVTSTDSKTSSSANVDVSVSGGFGGLNGKACVGTGGTSTSVSVGTGASVGISQSKSWDGRKSSCATASGTVPVTPGAIATGSGGVCADQDGKAYSQVKGGAGVGAGVEGFKVGVTVEVSQKTPLDKPGPGGGGR